MGIESQVRGNTSLGLIGMWGVLGTVWGLRGVKALELHQVDALGLVHRPGVSCLRDW